MSGVTPLVDTLLATRLGQRVDLVPLKPQAEIAGPSAVANAERVENDVRLPSREALQRQLGVGLAGRDGGPPGFARARPDGAVTLSAAARTVSALLNLPVGTTTPAVHGRAPLQADMRASVAPVLTATLARTVAESGLFYESHLQQYVAGQRTLAQLAREPQAGLAFPAIRAPALDVTLPPPPASPSVLPGAALALSPVLTDTGPAMETPEMAAPPAVGIAAPDAGDTEAQLPVNPPEPPIGSVGWSELTGPAITYGRTGLPDPAPPRLQDFSLPDTGTPDPEAAPADAVRAIHPEVVGLVRQQLDMLTVPVFRWSGEGWPGIPMDWEIRQERDRQEDGEAWEGPVDEGEPEAPHSAWTTRMTLKLPTLGTVDMRLGLAGATLQLHLEASKNGTAAVLNQASAELLRRFGAVGLELTDLKIRGAVSGAGAEDPADLTGVSNAG